MSSSHPNTALILIDPYNDFLHPEGKVTPALASSLSENDTIRHIKDLLAAVRKQNIPVFYALHQQYQPGAYHGWKHMTNSQTRLRAGKVFEEGSWGAQFFEGMEPSLENGDVVVSKHWGSSSFENTDLDYQLRQHQITKLVFAGLVTNTCIESTARYAYELGYDVTMLKDATAGFTIEQHKAATELIWPLFANKVTTVDEYVESLGSKTSI